MTVEFHYGEDNTDCPACAQEIRRHSKMDIMFCAAFCTLKKEQK